MEFPSPKNKKFQERTFRACKIKKKKNTLKKFLIFREMDFLALKKRFYDLNKTPLTSLVTKCFPSQPFPREAEGFPTGGK